MFNGLTVSELILNRNRPEGLTVEAERLTKGSHVLHIHIYTHTHITNAIIMELG